jgi:hypothetical protein
MAEERGFELITSSYHTSTLIENILFFHNNKIFRIKSLNLKKLMDYLKKSIIVNSGFPILLCNKYLFLIIRLIFLGIDYPLIAPPTTPLIIYRCRTIYNTITGAIVRTSIGSIKK